MFGSVGVFVFVSPRVVPHSAHFASGILYSSFFGCSVVEQNLFLCHLLLVLQVVEVVILFVYNVEQWPVSFVLVYLSF